MGRDEGPRSDIICLNAAPLLYIMGKARSAGGIDMARGVIMNGRALDKLRAWVSWRRKPDDGLPILEDVIRQAAEASAPLVLAGIPAEGLPRPLYVEKLGPTADRRIQSTQAFSRCCLALGAFADQTCPPKAPKFFNSY